MEISVRAKKIVVDKKEAFDYILGADGIKYHGQISFDVVISDVLSISFRCL
tara:strand:+ start:539 stop:691 length:153 start_codon:yes stop_codon:yes gene_type:complete